MNTFKLFNFNKKIVIKKLQYGVKMIKQKYKNFSNK